MNRRLIFAQAAVLLALAIPCRAADMIFLELKGIKFGQIKGDVTQKGREGTIACLSFEQAISLRLGASAETMTIMFRKRIDKSSPLLIQALAENQSLEARFRFWRPQIKAATGVGSEEQFYTIDGKVGRVLSVKILSNNEDKQPPLEEVTLSFSDLTWTYNEGGITYQIKK